MPAATVVPRGLSVYNYLYAVERHLLFAMRTAAIVAALAAASTAHAHATFQYIWVNGVDQGNTYVRTPANNSPVTDLSSNTLACNVNGEVPAAATLTIAAGAKVAVEMHQQPGDRTCTTEAIGGNHDGPTIIYMAKVDNAATAVGSSANWFKVAQTGLVSTDYWGTDVMNANCGKVEFTVPSDLPAGNYLIRAEVIALHVAGSIGGAQLYMSCYQINVTGGGAASPATVKFPGAYSPTDPGILFDLYGGYTSYTIPGPAVYVPGSSTGSPTTVSNTGTTPTSTSTSASATATGPVAVKYAQCGGIGWTGATQCITGTTCTKLNDGSSRGMRNITASDTNQSSDSPTFVATG
ncbi:hypothetical protein CTheo_7514 [Ceratobasidium theobromae]|uniref:AA9 family lytic polysaccharide monooxygenase n=1 Tax=Ceratobasidium theobromae TaxID=1582974 RepID=A0A5N5QC80_9AGAM|nr:hypothetical protein CTheo_7514 [Ceratobasidium theobromae]